MQECILYQVTVCPIITELKLTKKEVKGEAYALDENF